MKKFISFIMAFSLMFMLFDMPADVFAANDTSGNCGAVGSESSVTWKLDGGTLTISGNGSMADYFSSLDTPWYDSRNSIRAVVIGDGVTYIGDSAFQGCSALETVTFSNTVECIGETAFMNCTSLRSPAFPASIKKICRQAFAGCESLDSLVLTGVTEIEVRAFEECSSAEFSYDIDAIARCKGLKSVSMPALTVLGERAFARCFNLEFVSMPKLTVVSSQGFSNCRMLTSIDMPSVNQIGDNAFENNPSLEILEIKNIVSIGKNSFTDDSNAMIFIPEGCTYEDNSFGSSTVAVEYTVNGGETPLNIIRPSSFSIHFPEKVGGGKVVSANWEWYKAQMPKGKITHDGEHNPGEDSKCKICGEHVHKWGEWQIYRNYHERSCEMLNQPGGCTRSDGYEFDYHYNHYEQVYAKEPTCTEDGNEWGQYCSVCDYFQTEPAVIPALGHDTENQEWEFDEKQHWRTCGRCNDKADNADHAWDNGVVITESTEITEGVKTYTCTVCQTTKNETIPMIGHTHAPDSAWDSDTVGHWHNCPGCTEKVDYSEHTENGGVETLAPTETTEGEMTYRCTVCGAVTRTETIPATGAVPVPTPTPPSPPYYPVTYPDPIVSPAVPARNDEPFIVDHREIEGWEAISEDINITADGGIVDVDMNGTIILPKNIVEDIAGWDIDLVLEMGGGITWTINGMTVTDAKRTNMKVYIDRGRIPNKVLDTVSEGAYVKELTLKHTGEFGFTPVLTLKMPDNFEDKYANLFYYNPKSGEMEFVNFGIIGDGAVKLAFGHASEYAVVVSDVPMGGESVSVAAGADSRSVFVGTFATEEVPKYGMILIAVVGAAVLALRKCIQK